jgi:hypothetical protein
MEVSTGENIAVLEDERVVSGGVDLPRDDPFDELDRVQRWPVNLRHTAERVRILNTRVAIPVRFPNLAPLEERSKERR